MQLIKPNLRLMALAAAVIAAVLLGSSLAPSAPDETFAAGDLTGVSCADVYLHNIGGAPPPKGTAPAGPLVAKSISRTQPAKSLIPGHWDVTVVSYLGPDTNGDLVPDQPPTTVPCNPKSLQAKAAPEANTMNPLVKFEAVGNKRPTAEAIEVTKPGLPETAAQCIPGNNVDDDADLVINDGCASGGPETAGAQCTDAIDNNGNGLVNEGCAQVGATAEAGLQCTNNTEDDGDPPGAINDGCLAPGAAETGLQCANHVDDDADAGFVNDGCPPDGVGAPAGTYLRFSGCAFSTELKVWIRTDTNTSVNNKGTNAKNLGVTTLYLGTSSPIFDSQGNPDPLTCNPVGSVAFNSVIDVHSRIPRTDDPLQVAGPVSLDCDGNLIGTPQPNDGLGGEGGAGPPCGPNAFVPDDWDGDGCPDWDELAPKFKDDRSGRDPFNPNDCAPDSVLNLTGTYNILATAFPAAKQGRIIGPKTGVTNVVAKEIKDYDPFAEEDKPPIPEVGPDCANAINDDGDKAVNDGCPQVNAFPEQGVLGCTNAIDEADEDPGAAIVQDDLVVNDGCPAVSNATCKDTLDNNGDTVADKDDPDCLKTPAKHASAIVNVVNPAALKQNQKVYWDTSDDDQRGWWQVTSNPSTPPIELQRLFAPPCGLINTGIPAVPMLAPGQLMSVACDGPVQSGNYFHCISRIDHDITTNQLDSNLLCYIDAPGLGIPGSPLKSAADGNAGPPPPPPYLTGGPSKLQGYYDKVNNQIHFIGCFENAGPPLGPNIIVQTHVDAKTLKGFTTIFGQQSIKNCANHTPVVKAGPPATSVLQVSTVLARQNKDFDHDGDGCKDYDELGHGKPPGPPPKLPPPKLCGDDPYNPLDSDANYNSAVTISVTVVRADVCQGGLPVGLPPVGCNGAPNGQIAAGSYFHCIGDQQHAPPAKTFTTRLMCYTDNPVTTVNCQDAANSVANPCVAAITCAPFGPAHPSRCGDGLPGITPPSNAPQPSKAGSGSAYGDIDATHTQLSGTIDNTNNVLNFTGCFNGVESPTQGPSIYTRATIDAHTGAGTVDIFLNQPANCTPLPVGEPAAPYNDVPIETAEQATKTGVTPTNQNDTDGDGCSEKQELRDTVGTGGRRDPYNRWDLMAVWHGSPLIRDKIVNAADLSAVVARFGATDTGAGDFDRNSNPTLTPNLPILPSGNRANYHPSFDREGTLVGSNAWNLKPPNGNVGAAELANAVAQFGHNCNT